MSSYKLSVNKTGEPLVESLKHMKVYISGFRGLYPLHIGVAYHYRGHHIYSEAGLPLQVQPYTSKGKILIHGMTQDSAPPYSLDPRLPGESRVNALGWAKHNEYHYGLDGCRTGVDLNVSADSDNRLLPQQVQPSTDDPLAGLSRAEIELAGLHIPQGQDHSFNASARTHDTAIHPAVRLVSSHRDVPTVLLPSPAPTTVFPTLSRSSSGALLYQGETLFVSDHEAKPHDRAKYLAISAPGSRMPSRKSSRDLSPDGLPRAIASSDDLQDLDEALSRLQTGRPRGASLLLNQGWNAGRMVLKCPIHDDGCDGKAVCNPHLTEQLRLKGQEFGPSIPYLDKSGRKMVDWARLLQEEKDGTA